MEISGRADRMEILWWSSNKLALCRTNDLVARTHASAHAYICAWGQEREAPDCTSNIEVRVGIGEALRSHGSRDNNDLAELLRRFIHRPSGVNHRVCPVCHNALLVRCIPKYTNEEAAVIIRHIERILLKRDTNFIFPTPTVLDNALKDAFDGWRFAKLEGIPARASWICTKSRYRRSHVCTISV